MCVPLGLGLGRLGEEGLCPSRHSPCPSPSPCTQLPPSFLPQPCYSQSPLLSSQSHLPRLFLLGPSAPPGCCEYLGKDSQKTGLPSRLALVLFLSERLQDQWDPLFTDSPQAPCSAPGPWAPCPGHPPIALTVPPAPLTADAAFLPSVPAWRGQGLRAFPSSPTCTGSSGEELSFGESSVLWGM